jgi:hypothetical protein
MNFVKESAVYWELREVFRSWFPKKVSLKFNHIVRIDKSDPPFGVNDEWMRYPGWFKMKPSSLVEKQSMIKFGEWISTDDRFKFYVSEGFLKKIRKDSKLYLLDEL